MFSTLESESLEVVQKRKNEFLHHRGPVTCACPVPNSSLVLCSGYDGAVSSFDTKNATVDLLGYHAHLVNRVSVNHDGSLAATCSSDFNIHLWDLRKNTLRCVLRGHADDVEDFIFIDQRYGASVSRDWRVQLWDLQTGAIEHIYLGHAQDVLSISYHDGKLFTSGDDMTLRVWSLAERKLIKTLGPFETEADTCAIDPLNYRIILGCDDGLIRIFDIDTGGWLLSLDAHQAGIKKVACSPLNGDILSAAYDQRILVWDAQNFSVKSELQHRSNAWERSFNWSSDGALIYAGTFDGTLLKWSAETGLCESEYGLQRANGEQGSITPGNACFNDVAVLDADRIATVSDDGLVRVGKLSETQALWQQVYRPEGERILMNAITSNHNESMPEIVTGTHGQTLQRYAIKSGELQLELCVNLQQGPINCIRIAEHPDFAGDYFVACYTGGILHVARNGDVLNRIHVHDNAVKALAIHPSKALGVSCSADGVLASWDFSGKVLQNYTGHLAIIDDVDISANGQLIASVGRDFTLKVHRLSDGLLLHNIGLGRRSPKAVQFIGNDIVIVANYWGELLRVNLNDESVSCKKIAENGLSSLALQDDHIIASSYDGAVYLIRQFDLYVLNCLRAMTQRINSPAFVY